MSNSKYKLAEKMVLEISEKTGYSKEVINIVIKHFFISIRNLFRKKKEINIKGHIVFKLKSYYRKKVEKKGINVNLRPRKSDKWKYVKKRYKDYDAYLMKKSKK